MKSKRQNFKRPANEDEIRELAHLHATEGFGDGEEAFLNWLDEASAREREVFKEEVNAVGMLSLAVTTPVKAPALKLDAIAQPRNDFPAGFIYLANHAGEWRELPVKGARIKELSDNRADGFTVMLLEMDAGARFPGHHHHGAEHVYLLDGDLSSDGKELFPGDFLRAAPDTHHGGLYSETGCHALIITARENYPRRSIHFYDRIAGTARRMKRKLFR
jgi:quercetin dioxygenase-like cupin family protein